MPAARSSVTCRWISNCFLGHICLGTDLFAGVSHLELKSEIELLLVGNITWPEKWGGPRKSFCHSSDSFLKRMLKHSWSSAFVMAGCESTNARSLKHEVTQVIPKVERNWKSFHFIDYRSLKAKTLDNIWESCKELITEKFAVPLFPLHNTSRATRDLWTSREFHIYPQTRSEEHTSELQSPC